VQGILIPREDYFCSLVYTALYVLPKNGSVAVCLYLCLRGCLALYLFFFSKGPEIVLFRDTVLVQFFIHLPARGSSGLEAVSEHFP